MSNSLRVRCAIAGGGPAGMMLGYLLARAGVSVAICEKHADFLRDFRGDTVHPSTLEIMKELGLLERFLRRPHQEVRVLSGRVNGRPVTLADFSQLSCACPFIALMPQWDFLNFIAEEAQSLPTFHLFMQAEATRLTQENGRVIGLKAQTPQGELTLSSDLVVGADGRHSTLRRLAGLEVKDSGAPIDVLWLRLSRKPQDPDNTFGNLMPGKMFVMLNRESYWQCAYVIAKGMAAQMHRQDISTLRISIEQIVPFLADRVGEIQSWDDAKLLTVSVDHLAHWWKPGVLCIGDAAHAMSPVGGVGINLAIQDAVAAANILAPSLLAGMISNDDLVRVQARREWPARMTQRVQVFIHHHLITRVLASKRPSLKVPFVFKLLTIIPWLRRIPAYLVGIGVRPEHVHSVKAVL